LAQIQNIPTQFLPRLSNGAADALLRSSDLTIAQDGQLRVAYAPFDHVTPSAQLVIVGITPGETQAVKAIQEAQSALQAGASEAEVLARAKVHASFSGPMRANLIAMLDAVGVGTYFNLRSSADLFTNSSDYVQFTSALRYPVFRNGKNYNGVPSMLRTPILRKMLDAYLAEEVRQLPTALWLPLGPKANEALRYLTNQGLLNPELVLSGLPHPSGANAERIAVFVGRKASEAASRQTNGAALVDARHRLSAQIARLKGDIQ
jgi:hypothetical protein|tara:strand:- start:534 stop:1319 length:786 start_codon:yes stop_codon:yes gene_type:complete